MKNDHDPVDSALSSLRSCEWTGDSYNHQLEERLMQEFAKNPNGRRFSKVPAWLVATAGILLVGGAATGTVALVRSWMVTVQIGDKQYQFQTDANGEGDLQVQTEDGKTANVHLQTIEGDNGQHEMNVNVDVADANNNTNEQQIMRVVRKSGGAGGEPVSDATVADLAGTAPAATWNADGKSYAIHLVSGGAGTPIILFLVTNNADGSQVIRKVTDLPGQLNAGVAPEVSADGSGFITLKFDHDGNVNVMKFKVTSAASNDGTLPANDHIQIDPAAGQIRINGNPSNGG